jgi:hypothetical protein
VAGAAAIESAIKLADRGDFEAGQKHLD